MNSINGLTIKEEAINSDLEGQLLKFIYNQSWDTTLKRRTQHYGYRYNYINSQIDSKEQVEPIPDMFKQLMVDLGLQYSDKSQIIVNEYKPGQGIAPHIDNPKLFGDQIATLSLGAGIQMDFVCGGKVYLAYLKRRSLVILENDARYTFTHEIIARKSDYIYEFGKKIPRGTRVSITFRSLI